MSGASNYYTSTNGVPADLDTIFRPYGPTRDDPVYGSSTQLTYRTKYSTGIYDFSGRYCKFIYDMDIYYPRSAPTLYFGTLDLSRVFQPYYQSIFPKVSYKIRTLDAGKNWNSIDVSFYADIASQWRTDVSNASTVTRWLIRYTPYRGRWYDPNNVPTTDTSFTGILRNYRLLNVPYGTWFKTYSIAYNKDLFEPANHFTCQVIDMSTNYPPPSVSSIQYYSKTPTSLTYLLKDASFVSYIWFKYTAYNLRGLVDHSGTTVGMIDNNGSAMGDGQVHYYGPQYTYDTSYMRTYDISFTLPELSPGTYYANVQVWVYNQDTTYQSYSNILDSSNNLVNPSNTITQYTDAQPTVFTVDVANITTTTIPVIVTGTQLMSYDVCNGSPNRFVNVASYRDVKYPYGTLNQTTVLTSLVADTSFILTVVGYNDGVSLRGTTPIVSTNLVRYNAVGSDTSRTFYTLPLVLSLTYSAGTTATRCLGMNVYGNYTYYTVNYVLTGTGASVKTVNYALYNHAVGGSTLATNDTTFMLPDTCYNLVVTPYNGNKVQGATVTLYQQITLPEILLFRTKTITETTVAFDVSGYYYANVVWCSSGSTLVGAFDTSYTLPSVAAWNNVTSVNTNLLPGLIPCVSYNFYTIPYNSYNYRGASTTLAYAYTLPRIDTFAISLVAVATTSIGLTVGGYVKSYDIRCVSSGTPLTTNYPDPTYAMLGVATKLATVVGLVPSTPYTFTIVPYNGNSVVGTSKTASRSTLPVVSSFVTTAATVDITSVQATFRGYYQYLRVKSDGTPAYNTVYSSVSNTNYVNNGTYNTVFNITNLVGSSQYAFYVLPYNKDDVTGAQYPAVGATVNINTLPTITGFKSDSATVMQTTVNLYITGYYTSFRIVTSNTLDVSKDIKTVFAGVSYTSFACIDGSTKTVTVSGLKDKTAYNWWIVPYNQSGVSNTPVQDTNSAANGAGQSTNNGFYTLPNAIITAMSYNSKTTSSITFNITGYYDSIQFSYNDGGVKTLSVNSVNHLTAGSTITLTGLTANVSHSSISVTPYEKTNNTGFQGTAYTAFTDTVRTLPEITGLSYSSKTSSSLTYSITGRYSSVNTSSLTNDGGGGGGSAAALVVSGLSANTSYTIAATPYNGTGGTGDAGTAVSDSARYTWGEVTSASINDTGKTTTAIGFAVGGTYKSVLCSAGTLSGSLITGLTANTTYSGVTFTPTNESNENGAGFTASGSVTTLPTLTAFSVGSKTSTSVTFSITGRYASAKIYNSATTQACTGGSGSAVTVTITGLSANTAYTFNAASYNAGGDSASATAVTFTTHAYVAPTLLDTPSTSTTTSVQCTITGDFSSVTCSPGTLSLVSGSTYNITGLTDATYYMGTDIAFTPTNRAGETGTVVVGAGGSGTLPFITDVTFTPTTNSVDVTITGAFRSMWFSGTGSPGGLITGSERLTTYTLTNSSSNPLTPGTSYTWTFTPVSTSYDTLYRGSMVTKTFTTLAPPIRLDSIEVINVGEKTATFDITGYFNFISIDGTGGNGSGRIINSSHGGVIGSMFNTFVSYSTYQTSVTLDLDNLYDTFHYSSFRFFTHDRGTIISIYIAFTTAGGGGGGGGSNPCDADQSQYTCQCNPNFCES